jgi:crotonobetainyl-CoA:carnitine CoA-transferase CaiB-like acyl-CoA transferase
MLGQITPHHSPAHLQVNKNKRSLTVNLRREEGRAIFFDLLAHSDVFVDGFVAGACDRLGVGYEAQRAVKADIVYCHYSGFGGSGPYAAIPTHGQMMNALAAGVPVRMDDHGLVRRYDADEPMGGTRTGGDGVSAGGIHAAFHIAAALVRRSFTGKGCYLDAAGADGVVAGGWMAAIYALNDHHIVDRRNLREPGTPQFNGPKYQWYETSDGAFVLFCCIEHSFWSKFCTVVGRPDLVGDQPGDAPVDFSHGDLALRRELQETFRTRTQAEWVALAAEEHLPIGPSLQGAQSLRDDPHLAGRTILVDDEHPVAGPFTYVGEPVVVDGEQYSVRRPAPELGEHTDEILRDLGYDAERIQGLRRTGVV